MFDGFINLSSRIKIVGHVSDNGTNIGGLINKPQTVKVVLRINRRFALL
jgi:hypothetical protein